MVYLPTFTIKITKKHVCSYTNPMDFMGNEKRVTGFRGQRKIAWKPREAQYEEQVEQLKIDLELRRKAPEQLKAPIKRNVRPQKKSSSVVGYSRGLFLNYIKLHNFFEKIKFDAKCMVNVEGIFSYNKCIKFGLVSLNEPLNSSFLVL